MNKAVEVINAGVVGFGPDQNYIRFKIDADILKPDIVIFQIFADNDFGDIIRNRLFYLDGSGNLARTNFKPTLDQDITIIQKFKAIFSSLLFVKKARDIGILVKEQDRENACEKLHDKRKYLLQWLNDMVTQEYSIYKKSLTRKFSHFDDHYDIDIALEPDNESSKIK